MGNILSKERDKEKWPKKKDKKIKLKTIINKN